MGKRLLVVEDDTAISRLLEDNLVYEGFNVACATDGTEALEKVATFIPDLVLLDLMLPGKSGFEVCQQITERPNRPGIIVLTSRRADSDKVRALNLGADDYVTKPFGSDELLARIRVALRRLESADSPEAERIQVGDLVIDYNRRRVLRDEEEIRLTPKEFELLALLAQNPDRVLTHRMILKSIWGGNAVEQPEHLWVLMAQLRKKIEPDPGNPRYLITEPFVGYRLVSTAGSP